MVKINSRNLGINRINFKIKIKSKRISKIRLDIQFKINVIKYRFKKKKQQIFNNFSNNDSIDIIGGTSISQFDLFNLNINHINYAFSSSNLIKWMSTFPGDTIPTNPITNLPIKIEDRNKCYLKAIEFFNKNKNCNLNDSENQKLSISLKIFKRYEIFRTNPHLNILMYQSLISHFEKELYDYFDCPPDYPFCIICLQNYDIWSPPNESEQFIRRIKTIGYTLENFNNKILEIQHKIDNNYFI